MAGAIDPALRALDEVDPLRVTGRVRAIVGMTIRASVPGVRLGEVVAVERRDGAPLLAEVVGFDLDDATLLPLGDPRGTGPDDAVRPLGRPASVRCGEGMLGRVLDALGDPIDGGGAIAGSPASIYADPPPPLSRPPIDSALVTGVRAIDGLMTLGEGQRVGLFAGSGVGKSTLLARIARHAQADVTVVGLIGERGREVGELLREGLGADGLARAVVVVATSDAPALLRVRAAWTTTAIAEHFRRQGKRVLLLMDSVTRFARAAREVGLAAGEPPARRGYPPSVFAALPRLLERGGRAEDGTITAIYTVLVEGDDLDEPVADEVRGILDGHIVLDRRLAARGRWPAIDPLRSLSRVMDRVTMSDQRDAARQLLAHLAVYEAKRDLVLLGAYQEGTNPALDDALVHLDAIEAFLSQGADETSSLQATVARLREAIA